MIHTKRFTNVAYFVSCRMQFTKNALIVFDTTSTTSFLMFPVSLNTASSLDKKVSPAPAEVKPEEQGARSLASQTDRHSGLKTSSVKQAAPFSLYLWAQAFWKRVSALIHPSKASSISPHQKASDGGCYPPKIAIAPLLWRDACGLAITVLNPSLLRARHVDMYSAMQVTQGVPPLRK